MKWPPTLTRAVTFLSGRAPRAGRDAPVPLALALQGGGAYGAFTWGVLDRLLQDESIAIDAVSGSSAGAVNAVVMACGLARGGRPEARAALERFWSSASTRVSWPGFDHPFGAMLEGATRLALDLSSRVLSPYQTNPFDLNPLRDLLAAQVDFELLRQRSPVRLLIAASHVTEGRARLFNEREVSLESVLASACLPLLNRAVNIDGVAYWDGGYTANPPVLALLAASRARRLLIVQLTPTRIAESPTSSPRIVRRLAQFGFNTPLQRELEALAVLRPLYTGPAALLSPLARRLRRLQVHHIAAEDAVAELAQASPMNLDWPFLLRLHQHGRAAAQAWLAAEGRAAPTPEAAPSTASHRTVTSS